MADLPEEKQAAALRRVAEVSSRRLETIAKLDEELRVASIEAAQAGAQRTRIKELAKVSPKTLYGWLAAEGIDIRTKKGKSD